MKEFSSILSLKQDIKIKKSIRDKRIEQFTAIVNNVETEEDIHTVLSIKRALETESTKVQSFSVEISEESKNKDQHGKEGETSYLGWDFQYKLRQHATKIFNELNKKSKKNKAFDIEEWKRQTIAWAKTRPRLTEYEQEIIQGRFESADNIQGEFERKVLNDLNQSDQFKNILLLSERSGQYMLGTSSILTLDLSLDD